MSEETLYGVNRRGPSHTIPDKFFDRPVQISLPFRFDRFGQVATTNNRARQVAQNLATIASTLTRERVMRPTYGSNAGRMVFERNDEATRGVMADDLFDAFARWEPEARIESIESTEDAEDLEIEIEQGYLRLEVVFSLVDFNEGEQPRYSATISLGGEVDHVRIM